MFEQNIIYSHAILYLNTEACLLEEELKTLSDTPKFNDSNKDISMSVNNLVLEMNDIYIPLFARKDLSSNKKIFNSVKRLIGDFGKNLERCVELAKEGVIQNSFYFMGDKGLCDYSYADKLGSKKVSEWIVKAGEYSSDVRNYLPEDMKIPQGASIEFVSTFQKLRSLGSLIKKHEGSRTWYTIPCKTFAEGVENLLKMYDTVEGHRGWIKKEESRINFEWRQRNYEGEMGKVYVSKLVL